MNLAYPHYDEVPSFEFYIKVVNKIILEPNEVYLLSGDIINYRLYNYREEKLNELFWHNQQYYLSVADENIAKLQNGEIVALKIGQTKVLVHDRYFVKSNLCKSEQTFLQDVVATGILVVTKPKKLQISLAPYENWLTVEGENHQIIAALFNR